MADRRSRSCNLYDERSGLQEELDWKVDVEETVYDPLSFPFPSLHCLDLPFPAYSPYPFPSHADTGHPTNVSARIQAELRRSYEFENVRE